MGKHILLIGLAFRILFLLTIGVGITLKILILVLIFECCITFGMIWFTCKAHAKKHKPIWRKIFGIKWKPVYLIGKKKWLKLTFTV